MQRTLRIPSSVTPEAYFKVISEELARRILSRPYEADASFSTYSQALPSIESEYTTPSNICVSYNINDKPTFEQLLDGLPSEEKREIEKIYNSLSNEKKKELYDVLFYDKLITDVADSSRIKELRNKIYFSEIGKKSRKEVKRKIREEIERYLEKNVKPIIEEYRKELLSRANGESDLTNVINEIFSPQNAGDYLRALEYIKKIGFHNFLEELVFENENPSSPVEYLHEAIASDAMTNYLLRKGLYHISKDGALERASSYGEIFHKLSKQERKKVKEYEKKLGLRKSKAFAIGAASIILGAIGAAAYHAYKSGEKLKGDGSYFFHNPNDYIKYLKSIWNKHSNDIDNDGIPNDVEEKYGLDMFYAGDAGEDWDGDGLSNYDELIRYAALFGVLDIHSKDSDGDYLKDGEEIVLGTNPNDIDTDDDLLLDGYNIVVRNDDPLYEKFMNAEIRCIKANNSTTFIGEKTIGTNSTNDDSDRDGMLDGFEWYAQQLWKQRKDLPWMPYDPKVYNKRVVFILGYMDSDFTYQDDELFFKNKEKIPCVTILSHQNTKAKIRKTCHNISNTLSPNDFLYIIIDTHGPYIHLENNIISYREFDSWFKNLKAASVVVVDHCMAGKAVEEMENIDVVYTASKNESGPFGLADGMNRAFGRDHPYLGNAFKEADQQFGNNDGFVSFDEAFEYARYLRENNEEWPSTPLKKDLYNIGKILFLGSYRPEDYK